MDFDLGHLENICIANYFALLPCSFVEYIFKGRLVLFIYCVVLYLAEVI